MTDNAPPNESALDRAARALAETPVPAGPPPEVLRAVLDVGRPGEGNGPRPTTDPTLWRRIMRHRITRIAAVLALAVGIAAVILVTIDRSPTVAFARVREMIERVQTMTCRMHVTMGGDNGPMEFDIRVSYKLPDFMRQEITIGGLDQPISTVNIYDLKQGKMLCLHVKDKIAMPVNLGQLPQEVMEEMKKGQAMNFADQLKTWVQGKNEPLGEKLIDGREAVGFRVTHEEQLMDLWVDAAGGENLLRLEMDIPGQGHIVMTEFALDPELDMALFSTEIPEGYREMPQMNIRLDNITEDDLVAGLRFLAEANNDVFPLQPNLTPEMVKNLAKKYPSPPSNLSEEERSEWETRQGQEIGQEIGTKNARLILFLQMNAKTFKYVGHGVQLGDTQTPVCWYKPEGSAAWRIVYGALNVGDIAEEDLPQIENKPADPPPPGPPAPVPQVIQPLVESPEP